MIRLRVIQDSRTNRYANAVQNILIHARRKPAISYEFQCSVLHCTYAKSTCRELWLSPHDATLAGPARMHTPAAFDPPRSNYGNIEIRHTYNITYTCIN